MATEKEDLVFALMRLYNAFYFHNYKTLTQFDAMECAAAIIRQFPEEKRIAFENLTLIGE